MAVKFEPYEKTKTFDQLKTQVRANEALNGKLTGIERQGDFTIATFKTGMSYPAARRITLAIVDDDNSAPDDGFALVCRGTGWDAGKEVNILASRKKA